MSLLATVDSGNASLTQSYFIKDLSTDGLTPKVGTNAAGTLTIQSNPVGSLVTIRPDLAAAGNMRLGSSVASYQNIALADGLTTINSVLAMGPPGMPSAINAGAVNLDGDLTFVNGSAGDSISGYYSVPTAPINVPDGSDTVVPNPAGLTQGYYIVAVSTAVGAQNQQQVATLAYLTSGGLWAIGGCCSSIAGAGRFGLNVSNDRTTMVLSNSTGVAQNGCTVYFSKLMN